VNTVAVLTVTAGWAAAVPQSLGILAGFTAIGPKLYVEVSAVAPHSLTVTEAETARQHLQHLISEPGRRVWLNFEVHPRESPSQTD
jgi:hypothetical protein